MNVIDLFAGPGGWDVAAQELGLYPLGIEWDDAACKTREAAGLRTLQADVAELDPGTFCDVDGLIASPPCQAWSMAGKRGGERDKAMVYACADELAKGIDRCAEYVGACEDVRSLLVVEPVRWVNALHPRWVALEQVPPVLELWEHYAFRFRQWGYKTWTGIVNAANYGVPQTRQRAILLGRLDGPVAPPEPTHCRGGAEPSMFTDGLLPWVSMAEALGWDEGSALRHPRGEGMTERYGPRDDKPANQEAMTVTSKARSWTLRSGQSVAGVGRAERNAHEPAITVTGRADLCQWQLRMSNQDNGTVRPADEPAGTVFCGHRANEIAWENGEDKVKITVQEAAVLQSFDPAYPWQGSRTKQFEQVGNAIPPRLARHLLVAVTASPIEVAA